jgi:DNA ligase D
MSPSKVPAQELDVAGRTVRITSPDRVLFADRGITKLDVAQYFLAVGDGILGALKDRPTTLERWPKGWWEGAKLSTRMDNTGDAFYSKRVPKGAPDYLESVEITFPSGRTAEEVCPSELAVVLWAVNMGTLRFHPWPVRRPAVDMPDQLRVDLDPQPGTDFRNTVPVAAELRNVLHEIGMEGWAKTSGGRGLHIYIPVKPEHDFVEARHAVIALGREVERRIPDLVTTKWWKEERGERIFIDFNQMARDRTIASAYSVRPNARATVSAPLRWEEVPDASPEDFDVISMPARYAEVGDLHAAVADTAYDLAPLLEMWERDVTDRGLGEMPYPPDYPKMPGEPPRVQPSKINPANWPKDE